MKRVFGWLVMLPLVVAAVVVLWLGAVLAWATDQE